MTQQQNTGFPVAIIIAVLIGIVLGIGGYYLIAKHIESPQSNPLNSVSNSNTASTSVSASIPAGTANATGTTNSIGVPNSTGAAAAGTPGATSIDTSSWKTYSNYELGFSIEYPPNLAVDDVSNPEAVNFTFPSSYFSTAFADNDTMSVTVSATCTPIASFNDIQGSVPSQNVTLDGINFTENTQSGTAAGSHNSLTTYDTNQNDACYRISISSNGSNNAGPNVTDPATIAQMDAAHASDAATVAQIANEMLSTFTFVNTPAGENEADYSAWQTSQTGQTGQSLTGQNSIAVTTVSPIPVSVGGQLVITGSGFAGNNTEVQISNGTVTGILWGGTETNDSLLTLPIPAEVCTQYEGTSGAACPSYLGISSGVYSLTISNQNGMTQPVYTRVQ